MSDQMVSDQMVTAALRRPHVLVNVAMTADGKIDTVERHGARISSPEDIAAVDGLRAEVDAIMVGGATFLAEDPRLTVRDPGLIGARRGRGVPDQPAKVAVVSVLPDAPARDSRFLHDAGGRVTIFTTERTPAAALASWRGAGADVVAAGRERVDLGLALDRLATAGVAHLLVEGGDADRSALRRGPRRRVPAVHRPVRDRRGDGPDPARRSRACR